MSAFIYSWETITLLKISRSSLERRDLLSDSRELTKSDVERALNYSRACLLRWILEYVSARRREGRLAQSRNRVSHLQWLSWPRDSLECRGSRRWDRPQDLAAEGDHDSKTPLCRFDNSFRVPLASHDRPAQHICIKFRVRCARIPTVRCTCRNMNAVVLWPWIMIFPYSVMHERTSSSYVRPITSIRDFTVRKVFNVT